MKGCVGVNGLSTASDNAPTKPTTTITTPPRTQEQLLEVRLAICDASCLRKVQQRQLALAVRTLEARLVVEEALHRHLFVHRVHSRGASRARILQRHRVVVQTKHSYAYVRAHSSSRSLT